MPDDAPVRWARWGTEIAFYETELPDEVYATSFARLCDLQGLATSPVARGQGSGRARLAHVYAAAGSAAAAGVCWLTQAHKTRARALYDRVARETLFTQYVRTLS